MVDRLPLKPYMVVDLDGTLIDGNSFHIYLRMVLSRGSLKARAGVAVLSMARLLRLIPHTKLKFGMFKLAPVDKMSGKFLNDFVEKVKASYNPRVLELIKRYKEQGYGVLIATAAMGSYVKLLGLENFVATPDGGPECRGALKLNAVKEWLDRAGGEMKVVMTDHDDDMPLVEVLPVDGKVYYF